MKSLILFVLTFQTFFCSSDLPAIKKISTYLNDPAQSLSLMNEILQSGSIDGLFSTDETFRIFDHFQEKYPQLINKKDIGYTVRGVSIFSYTLSSSFDAKINHKKPKVLFTGAHHARELLTPTICLKIFIEALFGLLNQKSDQKHWKFNDLIIVPIVNIDSHDSISSSFKSKSWDKEKWRRKNFNTNYCPDKNFGVDLNRNYGFHFGESVDDLDPCSETYRGPSAFSEPETQAIRKLIEEENGMISSAMNFHSYGNIWIHPFNYMRFPNKYPERFNESILKFYEQFGKEVAKISKAEYGNAIETVGYYTDGEASDWMLGEHGIIAFSPELGSQHSMAQTFFLPKNLINEVIKENFGVIQLFLDRNVFDSSSSWYGFDNYNRFSFEIRNKGLSSLYDPYVRISSDNLKFLTSIIKVETSNNGSINSQSVFEIDEVRKELKIQISMIDRLSDFKMTFEFEKPKMATKLNFRLKIDLIFPWGEKISSFSANHTGSSRVKNTTFLAFALLILACASTFALLMTTRKSRTNSLKSKLVVEKSKKKTKSPEITASCDVRESKI